jgi:hypothetical protein
MATINQGMLAMRVLTIQGQTRIGVFVSRNKITKEKRGRPSRVIALEKEARIRLAVRDGKELVGEFRESFAIT